MSISRQNLTVIIVTFKSEKVIHDCIQSIDSEIKILIIDNSNSKIFKENLEKKYENVSCILSEKNLGMGAGNNLGIKNVKTDFAFILNPDVVLDLNAINEIIEASKNINTFGIIAPIEINQNYPNYELDKNANSYLDKNNPFVVKSVDGYAMLLNLKRINLIEKFDYFDENFFMYLENDDLCKRLNNNNEKIYIIPKAKIKHLGGQAVDKLYKNEVELSRNWHWMWSKFYFNKKYHSYFFALINGLPTFLSSLSKFIIYLITNDRIKKNICLKRMSGFTNAVLGKPSHYRPKIRD
jgi:N-acetylglucosaminyl-diphospho-decaprenol L-rhamnosyltransferase